MFKSSDSHSAMFVRDETLEQIAVTFTLQGHIIDRLDTATSSFLG